ncbi:class I SAM-dependent methyltransferase [Azoarcus sp. L1K30]|nr:class I SAM-dependent methyltransferase [Azoarcus sp. L1K30]
MPPRTHWENVYSAVPAEDVSWFQHRALRSLRLIRETGLPLSASILDVGGGASTLVDDLLREGYSSLAVLDLSEVALSIAKARLGDHAQRVIWIVADITHAGMPDHSVDIWHDRAVFHFLTSDVDRQAYIDTVLRVVKPDGHVIVATFDEDGPTRCSGLPVMRYSAGALHSTFGAPFELLAHERESHTTPGGNIQQFVYCHCRRSGSSARP